MQLAVLTLPGDLLSPIVKIKHMKMLAAAVMTLRERETEMDD